MIARFFHRFLHQPQQIWLRKAMFQIHLWVGIFVAIYIVLIGVSGSILVFREELTRLSGNTFPAPASKEVRIDSVQATQIIQETYPKKKITFMYAPRAKEPAYVFYTMEGKESTIYGVDPSNGKILGTLNTQGSVLNWVGQLHYFLLLGRSPGLLLNGIGSALLLLLTFTGMVLWWPGLKAWARGFVVDFSKSWKRINFDTHNVVGFWTLSIVSFWAISGVYFTWPREVTSFVNYFSPVSQKSERVTVPPNKSGKWADLSRMVRDTETRTPATKLAAIRFPMSPQAPFMFYMAKPDAVDLTGADFVYYEPATGKYLKTVERSEKKTAGDWIIWAMHPLHFGTSFGMAVKILYFILGFSLPLLVITGVLMYWNRYLGKKWKQLKQPKKVYVPPSIQTINTEVPVRMK